MAPGSGIGEREDVTDWGSGNSGTPYPSCGAEPWPLLPVASRGRGAERGGLPTPGAGSQRVPVPERRDERTIVPGWAAVRAGHGHPTSPLCPQALPLSFLPPTKTLGIVWGGRNPRHNPFIIFLGKVLAVFPLNPVSMRQPKLRAGTSLGLARGALNAPAPGSAPASSGSRRCHQTEVLMSS
ncbi:hypothetical protein Nmel_003273 [Mimus melanotis]